MSNQELDRKRMEKYQEMMDMDEFLKGMDEVTYSRILGLQRLSDVSRKSKELETFREWLEEKRKEEKEKILNSYSIKHTLTASSVEEVVRKGFEGVDKGLGEDVERNTQGYVEFLRELHQKVKELGGDVSDRFLEDVEKWANEAGEVIQKQKDKEEESRKMLDLLTEEQIQLAIEELEKALDDVILLDETEKERQQKREEEMEKRRKAAEKRRHEEEQEELDLERWIKGDAEEQKAFMEDYSEVVGVVNKASDVELVSIHEVNTKKFVNEFGNESYKSIPKMVRVNVDGEVQIWLLKEALEYAETKGFNNVGIRNWVEELAEQKWEKRIWKRIVSGLAFTDKDGYIVTVGENKEGYHDEEKDEQVMFVEKSVCSNRVREFLEETFEKVVYGEDRTELAGDIWNGLKK